MFNQPIEHVTIVGTGLLGASVGLALREAGFNGTITGVARRTETLEAAKRIGAIDSAITDASAGVADADLVILATPVATATEQLGSLADSFKPSVIITDVGSTKLSIVAAARALPMADRFVGAHPMAGAETSGPQCADAQLFAGKPCVLTPDEHTEPSCLALVESMWQRFGMHIVHLPAKLHDEAVARVSHLPHVVSAALMLIAADSGRLNVASTGLRDTTRLAAGETQMWADILCDNAGPVADAIDEAIARLTTAKRLIAGGDRDAVVQWLAAARHERHRWAGESSEATE